MSDWEARGLLDGLDGDAREARRELLDELAERGVPVEELERAVAEDRLLLVPLEQALMSAPKYTLVELAERSGVPAEHLGAFWRAIGLALADPEAARFTEEDLETAKRTRLYLDAGFPSAELLGVVRVMSAGVARSAEATRSLVAKTLFQAGDTESAFARRLSGLSEAMLPLVVADLEYLMRVHLRELARHDAWSRAELDSGQVPDTQEVAVGFADLVGFTELGESAEAELGEVADRLVDMTLDRIRQPVRLVKTIGDAVMLVSSQPGPLVELLLDLVDAVEAEDGMPSLRAGASWGLAYPRFGDWYGATVNLASRIAGRARPGSVLVTRPLHEAVGELPELHWSRAGQKKLKNVAAPVDVWRVRRAPG